MRPLSVPELLNVWERGLTATPFERALAILSAASPESPPAALAEITVGRCDASLLTLREWAFGPDLVLLAGCPECRQLLETRVRADDLRQRPQHNEPVSNTLLTGGYELTCRPPRLGDLLKCSSQAHEKRRRELFECCVVDARREMETVRTDQLPDHVVRQAIERISAMDPEAENRVALTCPECHHSWSELFDVASFFWTEIDSWARRILRDVDSLARVYGWTERDVLALSPVRRQLYLAMAQA